MMNTEISEALYKKATGIIAGGVNANIKYRNPYPIFAKHASGSLIWDVDGNEYIDYVLSYGAIVLGHGHEIVKKAIQGVLETLGTTAFGTPSEMELELGQLLLTLYNPEGQIRMTNSGLEATLLAVRLAMAFTGKPKLAKFDGHYHGANPFLLCNYRPRKSVNEITGAIPKEPDSLEVSGELSENTVVLPFNNIEGTKKILNENTNEVAAIILEPFEDGYIPGNADFMEFLKEYAEKNSILLIFDEVKTGFRVGIGGGTAFYGIQPDLVCLGKIIGGGFPIGAVCGRSDIMRLLDPQGSHDKTVFHSGTFNGNPISVGVGIATIKELTKTENFSRLTKTAGDLRHGFDVTLNEFSIPHQIYGVGGIANYTIGETVVRTYKDLEKTQISLRKKIDAIMLRNGIFMVPGGRYSISLSHSERDLDFTIEKLRDAIKESKPDLRAVHERN